MNFRNNRGFSLIEVVVSGAILALVLLGIVDFTKFISTANRSNVVSGNFAQVLSNMDSVIKTPDCDILFANLPLVGAVVGPQVFPAGVGLGTTPSGFTLNPATTPPSGFAFMGQTPGDANHSFQFTVLKNAATTLPGFPNIKQDTVDFQVSLKKVDSTGKALPGAAVQTKDYILNLWVDTNTGKTIPPGPNGGTCTYNIPSVWNVLVTPAPCTSPNSSVTVTWQQQPVSAVPTIHPNWLPAVPGTAGVRTQTLTTPATNSLNLNVTVSVVDSLGNTATSVPSANFNSVYAPFLGPIGLPTPVFSTLPQPTLPFQITTSNVSDSGGSVKIVGTTPGYPVVGSPFTMNANGTTLVPVNINGPLVSPTSFTYSVTASNVCSPPLYTPSTQVATETYQLPCVGSCASPPAVCPVGTPYSNGCSPTACTCAPCTGCPAPSTFCPAVPPVPAVDSCGNACAAGTETNVCSPITAAACVAPATFPGSCGTSCPCNGTTPSTTPSTCPLGATTSQYKSVNTLCNAALGCWETSPQTPAYQWRVVLADDGSCVPGQLMAPMNCQGYDFSVPSNATISGIAVEWNQSVQGTGEIQDIALTSGGVPIATKTLNQTFTTTMLQTVGGSTDSWGTTFTPAIVNAPGFGDQFQYIMRGGNSNQGDRLFFFDGQSGQPAGQGIYVYYAVPASINGACGTAAGSGTTTQPTASQRCVVSGTDINFTGTGPWTWDCQGSCGGTTQTGCNTATPPLPTGTCIASACGTPSACFSPKLRTATSCGPPTSPIFTNYSGEAPNTGGVANSCCCYERIRIGATFCP